MGLTTLTDSNDVGAISPKGLDVSQSGYCAQCGSYLEVKEVPTECLICGSRFVVCPVCGDSVNEDRGEYTCNSFKCGYVFSLCPRCSSVAVVHGSANGISQYKCSNREYHGEKSYRFTPVMQHRQYERRRVRRLAKELKESNDSLTAREIANALSGHSHKEVNQSAHFKYPVKTVSRWIKGKKKCRAKPTIIERFNHAKQHAVGRKFFRCRAIRAIEQGCGDRSFSVCIYCDRERVKLRGWFCLLDLACPKCHSFEFIYYGRSRGRKRLKCVDCGCVYFGEYLE